MRPVKTIVLIGVDFETQTEHHALSEIIGAADNLRYAATTNKEI